MAPEGAERGPDPGTKPCDTSTPASAAVETVLFCALLMVRLCSAMWNTISDCDETYNFWEPTHYLLHNFGFQTWECSPQFALRSYAYIGLHAAVGKLAVTSGAGKVATFYAIRIVLGVVCTCCEVAFSRAAAHVFGRETGIFCFTFMLTCSGMFHASTAYLPASFCMYGVMLVYWAWLRGQNRLAVFLGVATVMTGNWPFVGAIFVPLALETVSKQGLARAMLWGVQAGVLFGLPTAAVDSWFYQRLVVPSWNLVAYNAFGGGGGSGAELYGSEPWSFYFKNVFLNLNVVGALALVAPMALFLPPIHARSEATTRASRSSAVLCPLQVAIYLSPLYLWFVVMTAQPHKEERFLFPVYPLFCLAAATTVTKLRRLAHTEPWWCTRSLRFVRFIVWAAMSSAAILGVARSASTLRGYSAPIQVFSHVAELQLDKPAQLCLGQEWYRFPTSFFVPSSPRLNVSFVRAGFTGHLPAHFLSDGGTSRDGGPFNDMNRDEPSRYVHIDSCDFIVDLDLEQHWTSNSTWSILARYPFLNGAESHPLFRAFYVPFTSQSLSFAEYLLLERKSE